jgi:hypothetical protein
MIAASPQITRSGIVFAAARLFTSLDDHHETRSSRQFLPTENPEGPFVKGSWGDFGHGHGFSLSTGRGILNRPPWGNHPFGSAHGPKVRAREKVIVGVHSAGILDVMKLIITGPT